MNQYSFLLFSINSVCTYTRSPAPLSLHAHASIAGLSQYRFLKRRSVHLFDFFAFPGIFPPRVSLKSRRRSILPVVVLEHFHFMWTFARQKEFFSFALVLSLSLALKDLQALLEKREEVDRSERSFLACLRYFAGVLVSTSVFVCVCMAWHFVVSPYARDDVQIHTRTCIHAYVNV